MMKNYQNDLLVIYCKIYYKRKEGIPLTEEEQRVWEEHEKQVTELSPTLERYKQGLLPWEQLCEKYNLPLFIAFPQQEPPARGRVRRLQPRFLRLTAAGLLILFIWVSGWFMVRDQHTRGQAQRPPDSKRLLTASGPDSLQLADGSKVWLNAATVLRYPAAFGNGERVVELEGEAYFEVAHRSAAQPFIVIHKDQKIQVLGTRFNVKAYREEAVVSTTLLEGSVSITHGSKKLLLKPGQQARLDRQGQLSASAVSLKEVTAWKNNYFTFTNKPLSGIMAEVARWYNMELVFRDPLEDIRFVINEFPRNEPLTRLLEILEASRVVRFEVSDRKIYISRW